MKVFFIVFILAGLQCDSNSLDKIQSLVQLIDENAVLKSTKNKKDVTIKRFVFGDYVKYETQLSRDSFLIEGKITTYFEKKRILCQTKHFITKYLKKGDWPDFQMVEIIWYFETEHTGVGLYRSIDFDDFSKRDSIETVLKTVPFDTSMISDWNYERAKMMYNR